MRATLLLLLMLVFTTGCPANFIEAYEVAEPRLMGVRVEVDGDPTNPRPKLTQAFNLRQYLAVPAGALSPLANRYSMLLALCVGVRTAVGTRACVGDQTVTPTLTPVSDTELLLGNIQLDPNALGLPVDTSTLDLSAVPGLTAVDRITVVGVFCVDGSPERVPNKTIQSDAPSDVFRCTNDATAMFPDPTTFTLSVFLDRGQPGDTNHNPSFRCDPATPTSACGAGIAKAGELQTGGPFVLVSPKPKQPGVVRNAVTWNPSTDPNTLPLTGCASNSDLLQVRSNEDEYVIRVRFDPDDRETYETEATLNGVKTLQSVRETLDLTSALTNKGGKLGEFESRLVGSQDDANAEISVSYKPPKQSDDPTENIPQNGKLVRFYFTLRDQRGGGDYAMRELCLVPGENQE